MARHELIRRADVERIERERMEMQETARDAVGLSVLRDLQTWHNRGAVAGPAVRERAQD